MKARFARMVALVFLLLAAVRGDHSGNLRRIQVHRYDLRQIDLTREFMSEGATRIHDRRTDELRSWFKNNQLHIREAPRISFRQLCFSFARDGERAQELAEQAFRKVYGQPVDSDAGVANLADHLTLQSYYGNRTPEQVANVFGTTFVRSLLQLKPGGWQGPIESESGWHLVWIDSITSGRAPFLPGG
jgi:peptidyl-prolyl cis-trans isomerase C